MPSEAVLKLIALCLFCACYGSFIWGMASFFRLAGRLSLGIRVVQVAGGAMVVLHFVFLCLSNDFAAVSFSLAAALYSGSLLLFWSAISIHRRRPPTLCFSRDVPQHLIVSGPYRWVRHPFYTAYMLAWLAGVVVTHQPWLLLSLLLMSSLYIRAAYLEERKFEASSLAAEFAEYRRRTGMFLPRII